MVVVISALCSDPYPRFVISAYRLQPGSSSWVEFIELGQPESALTLDYCTMDSAGVTCDYLDSPFARFNLR
jgi:hypothetical protein